MARESDISVRSLRAIRRLVLTFADYNKGGSGYIKFLVPHEKILRWVEAKLNLLGRLPHYVSVDQKTYGRYGVLPSTTAAVASASALPRSPPETAIRLGP